MTSFRKGDTVKFVDRLVERAYKDLEWDIKYNPELTHYAEVETWRPTTPEERDAWYKTDAAKGMNSAGESKLPPTATRVMFPADGTMTVLRGRAAPVMHYRKQSGRVMVRCDVTGRESFVKRGDIEHVVRS